jgi:hypothetical protein
MLTSLPPSGLLLFPPKQRVVCFPLVLSFNHQTELRLVIQLTRTPDQTSGRAFSYPVAIKGAPSKESVGDPRNDASRKHL